MKEDLLQYIWSMAKHIQIPLFTTDKQVIKVKNTGVLNRFAGPDFTEAILQIDGKTWAGHVEVHIHSSDWNRHSHQTDKNYQNVILHVVYEHDEAIKYTDGTAIPVLELKQYISQQQLETYRSLMYNSLAIPCQSVINNVKPIVLGNMIDRAMVGRLEQKSNAIIEEVINLDGDWNTVFYHQLANNFGFKTNGANILAVSKSIELSILAKHKDDLMMLEALFFGQANLLSKQSTEQYEKDLLTNYLFLKGKYNLKPAKLIAWKFVKTRPANFPTVRIAQFAMLVHQSSHLFSKILECKKATDAFKLLKIENTAYWQTHFRFAEAKDGIKSANLGVSSQHLIVVNTIVPFMFAYGKFTKNDALLERAYELLSALPAEKNRITKVYELMGFGLKTACDSQGAIALSKDYCSQKKCLECLIGKDLFEFKE